MKLLPIFVITSLLAACGGGGDSSDTSTGGVTTPPSTTPVKKATILPGPFTSLENEHIPEIEILDINNDGLKDIVMSVTDYGTSTFKILINQGDKSFTDQTEQLFPVSENPSLANLPYWVSQFYFVDLNDDGLKDLIAGGSNPGIAVMDRIYIQQADKSFSELALTELPNFDGFTYNNGAYQNHTRDGNLLPLDIDGDGDFDLVNFDNSHGFIYDDDRYTTELILEIRVYMNNSVDGQVLFTKSQASRYQDFTIDKAAFIDNPAVLDVNQDGLDDIVYMGPNWKGQFVDEAIPLKVLLNNGSGEFVSGAEQVIEGEIPALVHGGAHKTGDLNGDGVADILIGGSGYDAYPYPGERNVLLLSQPNGLYKDAKKNAPAFIDNPIMTHSTSIGDLNNDGHLDIVFADIAKGTINDRVKLLLNDGNANFEVQADKFPNAALYGEKGDLNSWTTIRIADMDNDGKDDIILGAQFRDTNSLIYWNDGSGIFK
jgi:hypothetical protein